MIVLLIFVVFLLLLEIVGVVTFIYAIASSKFIKDDEV